MTLACDRSSSTNILSGSIAGYNTSMTHTLDGSPQGNYQMIFTPYRSSISQGAQMLGTKYVSLHSDAFPFIDQKRRLDPQHLFWSNTKKIHHRDVLEDMIQKQAIYLTEFNDDEAIPEYTRMVDILGELQNLYAVNTGESYQVSPDLGLVLSNAQGMQLTNVTDIRKPEDYGPYGRLQIVEIDSGITKDQIKTNSIPTQNQTDRAVEMFLDNITGFNYHTPIIRIPPQLSADDRFEVENTRYLGKKGKKTTHKKSLRRKQ